MRCVSLAAPAPFSCPWFCYPSWIERTLDHIQEKYGSVDAYVKTVAKLDDATLAKLRANLLQ